MYAVNKWPRWPFLTPLTRASLNQTFLFESIITSTLIKSNFDTLIESYKTPSGEASYILVPQCCWHTTINDNDDDDDDANN